MHRRSAVYLTNMRFKLSSLIYVCVNLAALYSGGKDSTFAISCAYEMGHRVVCFITMRPMADD
ncbi:MAG TPA: hypothetical protein VNB95_03095, partial [Nitrososphaera sp.]|nr:hypothetical protein [Nitrososphaera sp.]